MLPEEACILAVLGETAGDVNSGLWGIATGLPGLPLRGAAMELCQLWDRVTQVQLL